MKVLVLVLVWILALVLVQSVVLVHPVLVMVLVQLPQVLVVLELGWGVLALHEENFCQLLGSGSIRPWLLQGQWWNWQARCRESGRPLHAG